MSHNYDPFFPGDDWVVTLHAGTEGFRNPLLKAFPDKEQAIDRYMAPLNKVASGMQFQTLSKLALSLVRPLLNNVIMALLACFSRSRTAG